MGAGSDRILTQKVCAATQKVCTGAGSDRTLTLKVYSLEPLVLPLQLMVSMGKQRVQGVKPTVRACV